MKQVVLEEAGRFAMREAGVPARRAGEALVRVKRVGICGTDYHAFEGRQTFFSYPRVLGHELGVEIVEVEANDRGLKAGDLCALEPYYACGGCEACQAGRTNCCERMQVLGVHIDGGMAELFAAPVSKLHRSGQVSVDELSLVEMLAVGSHAVARAALEGDERVVVVGAGPIGLSVVQFAALAGAKVWVVERDEARLGFCSERFELAGASGDWPAEGWAQVAFDATGHPASMQNCFERMAHGGRLVFVGHYPGDITFNDANFHKRELTLLASRNALAVDFEQIIEHMEAGRIDVSPWITHRLGLDEVPARFGTLREERGLVKAVVEVG